MNIEDFETESVSPIGMYIRTMFGYNNKMEGYVNLVRI